VTRTARGASFTVLAMLAFASMDAISKWLVVDYPLGQIMWIRYAVFCVFAWLVVRPRGFVRAIRSARPWLQGGRTLLALIESFVFVLAFRYLPLADVHALAATSPLIVIALGVLFLGEKAGFARWVAVVAGFIGMLLIVRPGFRELNMALLLPIVGAFMWGVYQILTRLCARSDSSDTTLVWSAFVAFAASTLVGPWGWQWPTLSVWALMIVAAVLGALAQYALILALAWAEASAVQPYAYTLLVWVTVLGLVVFGDFPDAWTIAGAVVIVSSSLFAWWRDRRLGATAA
jgi:drug/metabolite transporter (DMT)-like permease